jgi:gamma-glutamyl phosphate reductase
MPMKNDNNATEEDNNIDQSLSSSHNNNHAETVNTLIRENAKTINTANAKDNEKSQKINWWISELNSLGMKKSKQEEESNKSRELENLTDDIKQKFIYDYKTCYSE